jgi:hypothetical protein
MQELSDKTNGAAALKKPASFSISQRWESKLYEGLVFYLRTWTERRASRFQLSIADYLREQREILTSSGPLQEIADVMRNHFNAQIEEHGEDDANWADFDGQRLTGVQTADLSLLQLKLTALQDDKISPQWLRFGIHRFEGFILDGKECQDVELLLEHAPDDLLDEVSGQIRSMARLDEVEAKNSESPSTSPTSVDGETRDTTAASAGPEVSTSNGTVDATSQKP